MSDPFFDLDSFHQTLFLHLLPPCELHGKCYKVIFEFSFEDRWWYIGAYSMFKSLGCSFKRRWSLSLSSHLLFMVYRSETHISFGMPTNFQENFHLCSPTMLKQVPPIWLAPPTLLPIIGQYWHWQGHVGDVPKISPTAMIIGRNVSTGMPPPDVANVEENTPGFCPIYNGL